MELISEHPPYPVRRPLMYQNWESLTFLHWRLAPEVVRRLLPRGLELDTYDGAAWIGLTPFLLTGLRPPGMPALPWISRFPEMNVRTYVRGPDGERGIWFFSLEADRLAAVVGARTVVSPAVSVGCHAREPQFQGSDLQEPSPLRVRGGGHRGSCRDGDSTERARTLSDRPLSAVHEACRTLGLRAGRSRPWPLHAATLEHFHENVVEHSGLPRLAGRPLVHFSPGVHVRVGRPTLVRGIV